jgi:hypothetical protein
VSRAPKILFSALVFAISTLCLAQQPDYHVTQDSNREIYKRSAFVHGHRHGYEEGFHAGDEDYHLRRPGFLLQKGIRTKGYLSGFGDRKFYNSGFEIGYRAGYADSFSGHAFRTWNYQLVGGGEKSESAELDPGFVEGYRAGFINSNSIADEPGIAESAAWRCQQERHALNYCSAYGAGYVLGKTDKASISWLQKSEPTNMARNSGGH